MAIRYLAFVMLLSAASLPARGEIYECVDQNGSKRFTNIAAEARGELERTDGELRFRDLVRVAA